MYSLEVLRENTINNNAEYMYKINELNRKFFVTDQELKSLRVCGTDSYSGMKINQLINSVSIEYADFVCSNLENRESRCSALRWILRGLRPDLAVRAKSKKQEIFTTNPQLPISEDTIMEINRLNQKKCMGLHVEDQELEILTLRRWDFCSQLTNEQILYSINSNALSFIECHIDENRIKIEAMKWCLRGLDVELSIRRAVLKNQMFTKKVTKSKTNQTFAKKVSKKKSNNVNVGPVGDDFYSNAVTEQLLYENPFDFVILDTETTGIQKDDEIIQLSIINLFGETVYSSYFFPQKEIHFEAAKVNGLSKRKLVNAPLWVNEWCKIAPILANKKILIHNAKFDVRLIKQTCQRYNVDIGFNMNVFCTMSYILKKHGYKKLEKAIKASGYTPDINKLHDALYDCEMTLRCLLGQPIVKSKYGAPVIPLRVILARSNTGELQSIKYNCENSINPICVEAINNLNKSNQVNNEDLLNLKSYGRDIVTKSEIEVIEMELGHNIVSQIKSYLHDPKDQNSAMRWCKRGLRVDLAIRKQLLHTEKTM